MHQLIVTAAALSFAFAPVPPPRTGVAEAVLSPNGGAEGVRRSLLAALPRALQSEKVKGLSCLNGEKDPAAWLGKHLEVKEVAPGGPARARLEGCRPAEALALLEALVEAYEAGGSPRAAQVEALLEQRRALMQAGGNLKVLLLQDIARMLRQLEGRAVLRRPRLISTGKAR